MYQKQLILFAAVAVFFSPNVVFCQDVQTFLPPSIQEKWDPEGYFQSGTTHSFSCPALGSPPPRYELYRNGQINMYNESTGYFEIREITAPSAGSYYCRAINIVGASITQATNLREAVNVVFKRENETMNFPSPSTSHKIKCQPKDKVVPDPDISWHFMNVNSSIPDSKDVQFDGKDTIYFANLERFTSKSFWCNAKNWFLKSEANSSFFSINSASSTMIKFEPAILTSSLLVAASEKIVGISGQFWTLKCLFGGYPTPTLTWFKGSPEVEVRPEDWVKQIDGTHIASTRRLTSEYAGVYTCVGTNEIGVARHIMELLVYSPPTFISMRDRPHDLNATEGDTVVFNCTPSAEPPATIAWYYNGVPFNSNNLPSPKHSLNGTSLTIRELCKSCNPTNLAVIQCSVSNNVSTVYAQGYLNVLMRTKLDQGYYVDKLWVSNQNTTIECRGTIDPPASRNCTWFFEGNRIEAGTDERLILLDDGSLFLYMDGEADGGKNRIGNYKVQATNGYSQDEKDFKIVEFLPSPDNKSLWWISLIVLAILLLLLLLLLLLWCCCCKRKQKKDYPVDKEERAKGNDPVKELQNMDFQDYQAQSSNVSYTAGSGDVGAFVNGNPYLNNAAMLYGSQVQRGYTNNSFRASDDDENELIVRTAALTNAAATSQESNAKTKQGHAYNGAFAVENDLDERIVTNAGVSSFKSDTQQGKAQSEGFSRSAGYSSAGYSKSAGYNNGGVNNIATSSKNAVVVTEMSQQKSTKNGQAVKQTLYSQVAGPNAQLRAGGSSYRREVSYRTSAPYEYVDLDLGDDIAWQRQDSQRGYSSINDVFNGGPDKKQKSYVVRDYGSDTGGFTGGATVVSHQTTTSTVRQSRHHSLDNNLPASPKEPFSEV